MTDPFTFTDNHGKELYAKKWMPDGENPNAVVLISHGMAEHIERYDEFARFLNENNFAVYGHDHRGHGKTDPDQLGFADENDGFHLQVENIHDLRNTIKEQQPDVPQILFGHSMGSFLVQRYLQIYDDYPKAVIYSGSTGKSPSMLSTGILLSRILKKMYGPKSKSRLLHNMTFIPLNKTFKPNRTEADWLSRDEEEVDKYVKDPACGFVCTTSFFNHFLKGLKAIHSHSPFIQKDLPIMLVSGDSDPVSDMGEGVTALEQKLLLSGVSRVETKLYPDARHEILNELNKKEVMDDILEWMEKVL